MAESKVTSNFKKVFAKLRKEVKGTYSDEQMEKLGEEAADMIRIRTRLGYGVSKPGAKRQRLKKLSDEYIETRQNFHGLSEFTTPGRSNLTRTAQMLDSIIVLEAKDGKVTVGPQGARSDSKHSNDQIAEYVSTARPFISVSDLEVKKLIRFFKKNIIGKVFKR